MRMIEIRKIIKSDSYTRMRSRVLLDKTDDGLIGNLGSELKEMEITKLAFSDGNASKA